MNLRFPVSTDRRNHSDRKYTRCICCSASAGACFRLLKARATDRLYAGCLLPFVLPKMSRRRPNPLGFAGLPGQVVHALEPTGKAHANLYVEMVNQFRNASRIIAGSDVDISGPRFATVAVGTKNPFHTARPLANVVIECRPSSSRAVRKLDEFWRM